MISMREEERNIKIAEFNTKFMDAIDDITLDLESYKKHEIELDEQSEFWENFLKKHEIEENNYRFMSDDEINRLTNLTHEEICDTLRSIIENKKKWQFAWMKS